MKSPTVIYIIGLPASGKSTLAQLLSHELGIPYISKDELKATLFDVYGWKDREASMQAGRAGYKIIEYIIEGQLRANNSIIVESTPPKFADQICNAWKKEYNAQFIQIYCQADSEVVRNRFRARLLVDNRHVSTVEGDAGLRNLETLISNGFNPIAVKSEIIRVDTTNFAKIEISRLIARLQDLLD